MRRTSRCRQKSGLQNPKSIKILLKSATEKDHQQMGIRNQLGLPYQEMSGDDLNMSTVSRSPTSRLQDVRTSDDDDAHDDNDSNDDADVITITVSELPDLRNMFTRASLTTSKLRQVKLSTITSSLVPSTSTLPWQQILFLGDPWNLLGGMNKHTHRLSVI